MTKNMVIRIFERKHLQFWGKILKKVVEKFFGQMSSDEFFLKHALILSINEGPTLTIFIQFLYLPTLSGC